MLSAVVLLIFLASMVPILMAKFGGDFIDTSPFMLLGSPEMENSKTQASFQMWANPRKSAMKPRKRDLHEPKLMLLLGNDYDHRWMRKNKDKPVMNVSFRQ